MRKLVFSYQVLSHKRKAVVLEFKRSKALTKQSHFVAEELITLLGDEKSKVENGLLADRLFEVRADQLMVGR